ncbi:GNAT family N-acetyltransferase [Palleronia sp.]|uniref:GNAT family N-acetyltransferase n=1 Tax=Palleronia sp. TaxID=1940284 RepID=UPI0035C7FED2
MSETEISIEGVGPDVIDAYVSSGMERGKAGRAAIDWAFAKNGSAFAVARQEGKVVGVSGYVRSQMRFGSHHGSAYQAIDSFVSDRMRGQGIFTKLARAYDAHAQENGADLVWGFPNDNAAPAWFKKMGWHRHGQVPFLIKPLRAGLLLRKLGLPVDIPLSLARDQNISPVETFGEWADVLWERTAPNIGCGTVRDSAFLNYRIFASPHNADYRVVADTDTAQGALVVTREAQKHGGRIAYLMEALGKESLRELLASEIGRLRQREAEAVLAWSYPWSPNYRLLRRLGFLPLPERVRPIRIWFGTRPHSFRAGIADQQRQWYLSYLDSDTV